MSKLGIHATKNAWNKMKYIMNKSKNNFGFIFYASSGGCNGFNFKLDLLTEEKYKEFNKDFNKINKDNINIYIDPLSEMYIIGTTIDYVYEDYSKGQFENKFIFTNSLLAKCGCGISFSPK